MSFIVETDDKAILFDTGTSGEIISHNLKILEKKEMESLEGLSADELRKLLDSLDLKKLL